MITKGILFWLTVFTFIIAIAGIYVMFIPAIVLYIICYKTISLRELITISLYKFIYKSILS